MASACHQHVDAADWDAAAAEINEVGGALLPELMTPAECAAVLDLYRDDGLFRATIDMSRYRYGQGEYRYFKQPYPQPIEELKQALYPRLLPIARDWWIKLGRDVPWADTLDEWLDMCHRAGQTKSTAILLKYGPGDWNALHRDLHGELIFPLQVVINLNKPGVAHTGGEFLLVEQRPRAQLRPEPSYAARSPRCREDMATSSPPENGRFARLGDGQLPRYATEWPRSAPVSATPSAWSSTTLPEHRLMFFACQSNAASCDERALPDHRRRCIRAFVRGAG